MALKKRPDSRDGNRGVAARRNGGREGWTKKGQHREFGCLDELFGIMIVIVDTFLNTAFDKKGSTFRAE